MDAVCKTNDDLRVPYVEFSAARLTIVAATGASSPFPSSSAVRFLALVGKNGNWTRCSLGHLNAPMIPPSE